ncbi:MAG: AAA family ATPase [Oscillospiraceae bacterium]|nr:AAA family ATPase [Oscillospiraceae bacterium]
MKLIFISGAPGVGKTFFSRRLSKKLNIGQIVSTDNIREIMRAFKSKEESPILHNSAIKAVFDDYEPDLKEISGFIEQSKVLQEGINAIVERAKKSKKIS